MESNHRLFLDGTVFKTAQAPCSLLSKLFVEDEGIEPSVLLRCRHSVRNCFAPVRAAFHYFIKSFNARKIGSRPTGCGADSPALQR